MAAPTPTARRAARNTPGQIAWCLFLLLHRQQAHLSTRVTASGAPRALGRVQGAARTTQIHRGGSGGVILVIVGPHDLVDQHEAFPTDRRVEVGPVRPGVGRLPALRRSPDEHEVGDLMHEVVLPARGAGGDRQRNPRLLALRLHTFFGRQPQRRGARSPGGKLTTAPLTPRMNAWTTGRKSGRPSWRAQ